MATIDELKKAVLEYDEDAAVSAAQKCVKEGVNALDAVNAMGDALKELGDQFQRMEVFLPEVLLATDAFKGALAILEPELKKASGGDAGAGKKWLSPLSRATYTLLARIWSPPCSPSPVFR